jgi:hypothetical protein
MTAIDEEQYLSGAVVVNGIHVPATAANVRAAQPAGLLTYTVGAPFTVRVDGVQHVSLRKGQTVHLDSATRNAWVALGASLTLVA